MPPTVKSYNCKWCKDTNPTNFYDNKSLCKLCKIGKQKISRNNLSDPHSIRLFNFGYQIQVNPKLDIDITSLVNDIKTQNQSILDKISSDDIFIKPLTTDNIRNSQLNDINFDTENLLKEIEQIKLDKNFLQIDNELKSEEIDNLYKETDDLQLSIDTLKQENDILKNTNSQLTNQYNQFVERNTFLESEYIKFQQYYQEFLNNQSECQIFKKQFDFYKSVCPKNKLKDVPK